MGGITEFLFSHVYALHGVNTVFSLLSVIYAVPIITLFKRE